MKRRWIWAMAMGWTLAIAVAVTGGLAVLGKLSAGSTLTAFATALTYGVCIGVPATAVMPLLVTRLQHSSPAGRAVVSLLVPAIIAVPSSFIGVSTLVLLGVVPAAARWERWQSDVRAALLLSIAIGVAVAAYGHFRTRLAQAELELKTQELARERAEKLASEARLASLSSRLQPHFLFNTLNSISSLIRSNPPRAERVLGRFASLLRSSLDAHTDDLVALSGEMKLVADYLEIQHTRYADRLRYQLDVPEVLRGCRVPPFSVQTLVENSVKYAVAPSPSGSTIEVVARVQRGSLCIEVWDSGPGFTDSDISRGHGLDNLRERLRSLYGEAARLIVCREVERTRVTLELPGAEVAT